MKTSIMMLVFFGLLGKAFAAATFPAAIDELPNRRSCVGYETAKGMLFVATVKVVGVSCDPIVSISADGVGGYSLAVTVPTRFDSGNARRDKHVESLLGPDVHFEAHVPRVLADSPREKLSLAGTLHVGGKSTPVVLEVRRRAGDYEFTTATRFSLLGVVVPEVGPAGAIAVPKDELLLFGRIPGELVVKTLGKEQ